MTIENSSEAAALKQIRRMGGEIVAALEEIRIKAQVELAPELEAIRKDQENVLAGLDRVLGLPPLKDTSGGKRSDFDDDFDE